MKLIKLSNSKFVDPSSVEGVETGVGKGGGMTTVLMKSGQKHTTSRPVPELLRDIEYALQNQHDQFFGG